MSGPCHPASQGWRHPAGWLLLILLGAALIQVTGSFHAGYLSDDLDLLNTARAACLWRPAGFHHHFAPAITALFQASARHGLTASWWRALALLAHALNTLLVYALARAGLGMRPGAALAVAAMFAAAAAGYEALAWSCAIAYVLGLPWLLLAVLAVLRAPPDRPVLLGMALAALQAAAAFVWDWGALLAPLAGIALLAGRFPHPDLRLRRAVLILLPCAASWVLMAGLKWALGYRPDTPFTLATAGHGLLLAAAAPLTHLLPNAPLPFFRSAWGVLAALALWTALGWAAIRQRGVRTALALYLVVLLPVFLFGSLQSRYAYVAAPFLAAAVVGAALRIPRRLGAVAVALLLAVHVVFAVQRSQLWRGASRAADGLRQAVRALPGPPGTALVLVNLPDSYGPPWLAWRPFLWRNGLSAFGRGVTRVNTPGSPLAWPAAPIPVLPRERVRDAYPGMPIYEITARPPGDWRAFQLNPDGAGERGKPGSGPDAHPDGRAGSGDPAYSNAPGRGTRPTATRRVGGPGLQQRAGSAGLTDFLIAGCPSSLPAVQR